MTGSGETPRGSGNEVGTLGRAYLVRRNKMEFGSVHELDRTRRLGLGRANSNFIVLSDDGCSRNHAEVYFAGDRWRIHDLGSLNGTRLNERIIESPTPLKEGDVITIGQTVLVYMEDLSSLKLASAIPNNHVHGNVSIVRRQDQTQTMRQVLPHEIPRPRSSKDLQTLYRMALRMGAASDSAELARAVLDGILEATAADSGGIIRIEDGMVSGVLGYRTPPGIAYRPPPSGILATVCSAAEAILGQVDVAGDSSDMNLRTGTLICAPVSLENVVVAVLYLYTTDPYGALTSDDMDLAISVAQQFGPILGGIERQMSLSRANEQLRETLRVETELIGTSPAIRAVLDQVGMVAPTDTTVLIRGESGVGKELVARSIHFSSRRREGPFVCLNCAALPETLLESELFGHEKGAFTGATDQKKGKFEVAHKGTIFLDEIGEMTQSTQSKFLRVLEGHPFERIGGDKPIRAHVRVVAATNRDLERAVAEGKFRNDLYYRLQVVEVRVPPLRDRKGDVAVLAEHFLHRFASEMGRKIRGFTPEGMGKLFDYHWPGNVRELKNVVERTVVLTRNTLIQPEDIWLSSSLAAIPDTPVNSDPKSLEDIEADHIRRTLQFTAWNKSQAASHLGIERSTLDRKIKRYGITEPS